MTAPRKKPVPKRAMTDSMVNFGVDILMSLSYLFFKTILNVGVWLVKSALGSLLARRESEYHAQGGQSESKSSSHPQGAIRADPYRVLRVKRNSNFGDIRTSYLNLVKMYHPDKVASLAPEFTVMAEEKLKEINRAYLKLKRANELNSKNP